MAITLSTDFSKEVLSMFISDLYVSKLIPVEDMKGVKTREIYVSGGLAVNTVAGAEQDVANTTVDLIASYKDEIIAKINDEDDAQTTYDMIEQARKDVAISLSESYETNVLEEIATGGTTLGTAVLTKTTVFPAITDAYEALSNAKVKKTGRWLLVKPLMTKFLLQSSDFIKSGDMSQELVASGAIGQIAGMNVYESAYLPSDVNFIAGHSDCAKAGISIMKFKDADASGKFLRYVSGLNKYGAVVTKATGIQVHKNA